MFVSRARLTPNTFFRGTPSCQALARLIPNTQLSGPGTLVWDNTEFNGVKDQPFCISYFYAQYFAEYFQTDKLPISQETVQPWFGTEAIEAAKWKFTNSFFKYFHP